MVEKEQGFKKAKVLHIFTSDFTSASTTTIGRAWCMVPGLCQSIENQSKEIREGNTLSGNSSFTRND